MSDIVLIGILILVNGFFAAAEMSLITARKTRLKALADTGDRRAQTALHIQSNPGDFLSAVQVGITLVGTAASAIGGVSIIRLLAPLIARFTLLAPYAEGIALTVVIVLISYSTLVFGELVPKRLALLDAEKTALALAGPLAAFSRLTFLPMRLLSISTEQILRLIGARQPDAPSTSSEEIEMLVRQGTAEGVFQAFEERLISGVFDYTARRLHDVMTPRTAIKAFDATMTASQALDIARRVGYSRYPVYRDSIDCILGYVHVKDLIWADANAQLEHHYRQISFIPASRSLPEAFDVLVKAGKHMAIVIDEFGGTYGLLTLEDLLEEIVGEIEDEHSPIAHAPVHQQDEAWRLPGQTPISEVGELLKVKFQPKGQYKTIAGFIMAESGRLPSEGDRITRYGYVFTVLKRENLRIVEVGVKRAHPKQEEQS